MHSRHPLHVQQALLVFPLLPLLSLANEADNTVVADPHAPHHEATPQMAPSEPPTPPGAAKLEAEAPETGESSGKGLVVHRAPDFCMKKDPPPHCSE